METVKLMGGMKATAMQSIQVHLSGAARSWMKKLPEGSIHSWETFEDLFVKNFRSTCKKPASIEQLRTCKQKPDETIRAYIQRWSIIKNPKERPNRRLWKIQSKNNSRYHGDRKSLGRPRGCCPQ
jgi:hypothetical protein